MATSTATLTHCPTCGVKLERPELSLCAYCASPLRVGPVEVPNDETQKRLAKVKAHADFAAAQAWLPSDPVFERRARRLSNLALAAFGLALLGVAVLAWSRDPGEGPVELSGWALPAVFALAGFVSLAMAQAARSEHRRTPMLKRAAYVLDRRSETDPRGGVGSTRYFFKIRFDDGSEGEFSHVGRGSLYEPPANGAAGVAYTRGPRMIDFRRI